VTGVAVVTPPAITEKVDELEPGGTVTVDGTRTATLLELDNDIIAPVVPAAPVRFTVPIPDWPLTSVLGLIEMLLRAAAGFGGLTVKLAVLLTPE
jgi:hypothetical protein